MTEPLGTDVRAISRRAHELWLQRGCPTGTPELDWQQAEDQLRSEAARAEGPRGDAAPVSARAESVPRVPRPRAPRTVVTRAGHAPAARLLVALVPGASLDHAAASPDRASRR